jgi:hypothetical protein
MQSQKDILVMEQEEFYEAQTMGNQKTRGASPIIFLLSMNNYIKALLIS